MTFPRPRLAHLAAALILAGTGTAIAGQFPQSLVPELIGVEREVCKSAVAYGKRFENYLDINGDKRVDIVLDYRDTNCYPNPDVFCPSGASGACLLKAYVADKGGWRKVYEGRAKSWSVDPARSVLIIDGKPLQP